MKYNYDKDYAPRPEDGRRTEALPAWMEYLRRHRPLLSLPEQLTKESFAVWKAEVRKRLVSLYDLPEICRTQPKKISILQRNGYRTEKWEFYPCETAAVPALVQVPDCASPDHPAPLVFCFPGAIHSKEFVAGEPFLERPAARFEKYPERNRMAQYYAENGMIAVTFDPISVGETAFVNDEPGDHGIRARNELIYGLMEYGLSYPVLSAYQAMCFMQFCKTLPYADPERIALSAHSLGTETALPLALLCDDIKALVFNDFLCDQRVRYVSITETGTDFAGRGMDLAHILPGKFRYFCYPDLCAAAAPMYLALNEGGAKEDLDKVRRAYAAVGAEDRLMISHYPKFREASSRLHENEQMPLYGLSAEEFFAYTCTDAPDHSFRKEPSLELLRRCFGIDAAEKK